MVEGRSLAVGAAAAIFYSAVYGWFPYGLRVCVALASIMYC